MPESWDQGATPPRAVSPGSAPSGATPPRAVPPGSEPSGTTPSSVAPPGSEPSGTVPPRLAQSVILPSWVAHAGIAIDGTRPFEEAWPTDAAELAALLARANADRRGVCLVGGGTKLGWGNPPDRFDLLVGTRGLCSIREVDADDLTATFSAGVTVAEARALARENGRVLPLDAPLSALATVGGVAATGDQGLRGAGYGRVRDLVLGLKAVLADGSAVKFGGRTMKNVAGYDMTKLFVGSFGALGVITEVTFRLLPRQDAQRLVVLPLPTLEEAQHIVSTVLDSPLQPLVLAAVSPDVPAGLGAAASMLTAAGGAEAVLLAGFAGHEAAVERSVSDVSAWSGQVASIVLRDEEAEALLDALTGFASTDGSRDALTSPGDRGPLAPPGDQQPVGPRGDDEACLRLRASVPISRVWDLAARARALATEAGLPVSYCIDGAWGVLHLRVRPPRAGDAAPGESSPGSFAAELRAEAGKVGGWLAVAEGLESLPAGYDAWGAVGPSIRLMQSLKQRFDPHGTLNPGRFVGGI